MASRSKKSIEATPGVRPDPRAGKWSYGSATRGGSGPAGRHKAFGKPTVAASGLTWRQRLGLAAPPKKPAQPTWYRASAYDAHQDPKPGSWRFAALLLAAGAAVLFAASFWLLPENDRADTKEPAAERELVASKELPEDREFAADKRNLAIASPTQDTAEAKFYVKADRLNRRTCPATQCGIVGWIGFREAVTVHETRDGWARITDYYHASCTENISEIVASGNSNCEASNGIVDGKFAEWISTDFLSRVQLPEPDTGATGTAALITGSDDFLRHRDSFVRATDQLMASGRCTAQDLKASGGWIASPGNGPGFYSMNCGGKRIQLNVASGELQ